MSTDNLHGEAEFERFLAGEDELSRLLQGVAQAEPSAELDAAVFARVEAAMAAEKVQTVETGPASNDAIGPPAVPLQRRKSLARSLAYYWHWPVGVAAGILAVLAYRTAFEPNQPAQIAMNDTNMRVIVPTPHVTEPADVVTVPSRAATAPAVIEPPDVPPEPVAAAPAPVSAPAQPLVASAKEAAPAIAARADEKSSEVTVTGSRISRKESTSAQPNATERVEVITASDIAKMPDKTVADEAKPAAKGESGVEMAWTHDPAQDARDSLASNYSPAKPSAPAAALPPPPPPAAVMAVPAADIAARAPSAPAPAAAPPASYADARTVTPIAAPPAELARGRAADKQVASADTQETQSKKSSSDRARTNPRRWLALIEQEIKDRHDQAALAEWDKFVAAYPSYKVKDKLRTDIEALRAQSQTQPASGK